MKKSKLPLKYTICFRRTKIGSGISAMLEVKSGGNNTKKISDKMASSIEQKLIDSKTITTSYVALLELLKVDLLFNALEFLSIRNMKKLNSFLSHRACHLER